MLFGCSKMDSNKVISEYKKVINNDKYEMTGQMDIVSNEELYHYDVTVDYMQGDYYKVNLVNKDNKHEQIILKNEDGVYVITPELNKSFNMGPFNGLQCCDRVVLFQEFREMSQLLSIIFYCLFSILSDFTFKQELLYQFL